MSLRAAGDNLSFAEADLMSDAGWAQAAAGCEYVLHVASPLPASGAFTEDEVVPPQSHPLLLCSAGSEGSGPTGPSRPRHLPCRSRF